MIKTIPKKKKCKKAKWLPEEALQKQEENQEEKQEEIEVNILEETIKEHKEKESTKIDTNQEVKIKEGSSQVPTNQRNPFEKK